MDIQKIKELALANGFKLKEQASGNMDLNAYVYDFANAIEQEVKAQAVPDLRDLQERIGGHQYYHDEHGHMIVDMDDVVKEISGFDGWKAQALLEGFVFVPKLLSDELADELAIDAFNNIQSMFDYEHRGSTATHREQIRLKWCRNKAREYQETYKQLIEAQEQKG